MFYAHSEDWMQSAAHGLRLKEMPAKRVVKQEENSYIQRSLEEFAALISNNLRHISIKNKQKLLRTVLDKVIVKDWRVDLY